MFSMKTNTVSVAFESDLLPTVCVSLRALNLRMPVLAKWLAKFDHNLALSVTATMPSFVLSAFQSVWCHILLCPSSAIVSHGVDSCYAA